MKLIPEQLIPYLPYSLKVIMKGKKTNVAWMSTKNIAVIIPNGIGEYKRIPWKYAHLNIKPILRLFSDLTYDEKRILDNLDTILDLIAEKLDDEDTDTIYPTILSLELAYTEAMIKRMDHLYKCHVDVYGLIEKGLAIDKKTLL